MLTLNIKTIMKCIRILLQLIKITENSKQIIELYEFYT